VRVGVFHPAFNLYGGAEFVAEATANTLAQNNYDVQLFVNEKINQREIKKFFGREIYSSAKAVVKPTRFQTRGLLDFYQTIFRSSAFKSKCDILVDTYSNCIFPWADICYIHFPFINRYFYKPHFPYLKNRHLIPVGALPYIFFEKNITKNNEKLLLANSHFTAQAIKEFTKADVKVLYPPIPSTFFHKNPANLTKNPRKNLVVTVSRFGVGKGLETIPYIAKLTDKNVNFAIIGLAHDKNIIQSILKSIKKLDLSKRVKLLTNLPKQEMKNILNSAKLYLHTTVNEHFGISIVEAMAMGCLPIVHNSGGVKEYLHKDYRYENIHDAAQKIEKTINDWSPSKAEQMIKIAERFNEENFSREFMKLFKQYVKTRF
jgi:alpha-1,2-mannosyltransferase